MPDMIHNPPHYTHGIECWDYITSQGMDYLRGNAIKYITRAPHKGKPMEDIDKAIAYLERYKRELGKASMSTIPQKNSCQEEEKAEQERSCETCLHEGTWYCCDHGSKCRMTRNLSLWKSKEKRWCENCGWEKDDECLQPSGESCMGPEFPHWKPKEAA